MDLGINWTALVEVTTTATKDLYVWVHDYVDVHYMQWLAWVFYPLILTIFMPMFIVVVLFGCALFLHLYQLRHYLLSALRAAVDRGDFWDGARHIIASLWDYQGRVWHGMMMFFLDISIATHE